MKKIVTNTLNASVFKFLGIEINEHLNFISMEEKKNFVQDGLEDFLKMELPAKSKFVIENYGLIVQPESGEIIAFQFGQNNVAFKILGKERYKGNYKHIRIGLLENFKLRSAFKVSLRYFSNVYNDANSIIDIRELGSQWTLSIYFVGQAEGLIQEYYAYSMKK